MPNYQWTLTVQYQHLVNFNASADISGAIKAGVPLSTSFILLESNVLV